MLRFLREHPCAPIYRNHSGNRLLQEDVAEVRSFERQVESSTVGWRPGEIPAWLSKLVEHCYREVPWYRDQGDAPRSFKEIKPITRSELSSSISSFVPDSLALDRLINFQTTGISGEPLLLPSHPAVAAKYLSFLKKALRFFDVELQFGRDQVGVVLVGFQRRCFTYVSVTPTQDETGLAKINLHPNDWNTLAQRAQYLDALNAEIYTGDPVAFSELARLPLKTRPKALLSTSMNLLPGFQAMLQRHFGCPVVDIYSLNETGTVAVRKGDGHILLQHELYLEIIDSSGRALPPGERGEIVVSGGFNPYLPLLRYRTADFAALSFRGIQPILIGLEGRPAVMFRISSGEWVNNIDVTHALGDFALSQYAFHQGSDGSVQLRIRDQDAPQAEIKQKLSELMGAAIDIVVEVGVQFEDKVIQYTSDLEQAWYF